MNRISFKLKTLHGEQEKAIRYDKLMVIGYAGRDTAKTMEHIKELEEQLHVLAPQKIPTIFQCSNMLLTHDDSIHFVGDKTCGEVEYIIIKSEGKTYIGVGSDHTDRELESSSVPKAKQACPKPVGYEIWDYSEVKAHWDEIKLKSYQEIDGKEILYQDGSVKDILPVERILKELEERAGNMEDSIIYSGTVPLKDGFKYGSSFRCEMYDPVLDRSIGLSYGIETISLEER